MVNPSGELNELTVKEPKLREEGLKLAAAPAGAAPPDKEAMIMKASEHTNPRDFEVDFINYSWLADRHR